MPTRASNARRPRDTNQLAWQIVQEATGQALVEPEQLDTRSPAAVALQFMWYNFAKIHQTWRVTPAMEAGATDHVWSAEAVVGLLDRA